MFKLWQCICIKFKYLLGQYSKYVMLKLTGKINLHMEILISFNDTNHQNYEKWNRTKLDFTELDCVDL